MVKEVKVPIGLNIYDISNDSLGGFDNIYAGLIQLNTGLNINSNIENQILKYESDFFKTNVLQLSLNISTKKTSNSYLGLQNQSLFDLSLMLYGDISKVYELINDNPSLVSINEQDVGGKTIIFDSTKVVNENLTNSIKFKGYSFNTLVNNEGFVWDGNFVIWDGTSKLIY